MQGTVEEGGDEEVWVKIDPAEATLLSENLLESVDWSGVGAVAGMRGLNDKSRTYEIEWG